MLLVTFDLDGKRLAKHYKKNSPANAWNEIRQLLRKLGYQRIGQSLYRTPKTSVEDVERDFIQVIKMCPWFVPAVASLYIFRGSDEENVAQRLLAHDSGNMSPGRGSQASGVAITTGNVQVAVTPA